MKIYVQIKSAGRRKAVLEREQREIPDGILGENGRLTGRALVEELVGQEVRGYYARQKESGLLPGVASAFLTEQEIEYQAAVGKVGFGRIYSGRRPKLQKAVETALQCWEDGQVRIFRNEEEVEGPETEFFLREGDCFTFFRLAFLSGKA